jgi:hypothetical protein
LQRNGGKSRNLGEPCFELVEDRPISSGLTRGCERVQTGKLGPGDRQHFTGGVELHGAGTERDHGSGQRQVAQLEPLEMAQHLGFRPVLMEYRVPQHGIMTPQARGNPRGNMGGQFIGGKRGRATAVEDSKE